MSEIILRIRAAVRQYNEQHPERANRGGLSVYDYDALSRAAETMVTMMVCPVAVKVICLDGVWYKADPELPRDVIYLLRESSPCVYDIVRPPKDEAE